MAGFTREVEKDFESTVKDWSTKVVFVRRVTGHDIAIEEISTTNKIYGYLSNGTRRHFVAPRRVSALRFQPNYRARTGRGGMSSRGGGASGSFVYSKGHFVNGIEARNYPEMIKRKREKEFSRTMQNALYRAMR